LKYADSCRLLRTAQPLPEEEEEEDAEEGKVKAYCKAVDRCSAPVPAGLRG
jgi:hypothetical protein